jgi:hypothetical protein
MTEQNKPSPEINSEHIDKPKLIFSDEEVRNTVKGFISAYVKGTITVNFANSESIKDVRKAKGEDIDDNRALNIEIDAKKDFVRQIQIITGRLSCTQTEFESAVNRIFAYLLVWRSSNRIVGTFMNYEMERKIEDIEQKLDATNNLVVELVNWLTEEAKGHDSLS